MGTQATPRPWTVEQAGKPSPLDEGVYDANHSHVNLYQHLDLIVSAVNSHDALVEALEKAIKFIDDEVGGYDIEAEEAIGARHVMRAAREEAAS